MKHTLRSLGAALLCAFSVSAFAAPTLTLTLDPNAGEPGKFAADEIRREATAKGIAIGDAVTATRLTLSVEQDAKAVAQSYRIRVQTDGGRSTINVRGCAAVSASRSLLMKSK